MSQTSRSPRALQITAVASSLLLASLPLIRLLYICLTTGAGNPSNDEWHPVVFIYTRLLDGDYPWGKIFFDAFYNSHFLFFPLLTQMVFAKFFHLNYFGMLFLGICLNVVQVYFAFEALTLRLSFWKRWALLPILSCLIFSVVQISVFEFAFSSLQHGMYRLGLCFMIWSMARFAPRNKGLFLGIAGAFFSCWSAGSGIVAWPILFLGMWLMGYRRVWHFLTWMLGAALSAVPYVYFLFLQNDGFKNSSHTLLPKWSFWTKAIGFPVALDFQADATILRGILGLVLAGLGILILLRKKNSAQIFHFAPSLLYLIAGLLGVWLIGIEREQVVSWYGYTFLPFWIGILGLGFSLLPQNPQSWKNCGQVELGWSVIAILASIFLTLTSNRDWENKSYFLSTRSPTSSSCLQHYWDAPTYCESSLFHWGVGNPNLMPWLGGALRRHRLSVFAPKQYRTLQGEFILQQVKLDEPGNLPLVSWTINKGEKIEDYSDYHSLNLLLEAPGKVEWTLAIPEKIIQAEFHTAVSLSNDTLRNPGTESTRVSLEILVDDQPWKTIFSKTLTRKSGQDWHPVNIALSSFRGKQVTLRFLVLPKSQKSATAVVFRHPTAQIQLEPDYEIQDNPSIRPENTDLNPKIPKTTPNDLVLDLKNNQDWIFSDAIPNPAPEKNGLILKIGNHPSLQHLQPLAIDLSKYSHFSFSLAAESNIYPRRTRLMLSFQGEATPKEIWIPLLMDTELHRYTYDLKLLGKNRNAMVTGLSIEPATDSNQAGRKKVELSDLRFIRKKEISD